MKTAKHNFLYFLGVDISKDTLDYTLLHQGKALSHEKIQNQQQDIKICLKTLLSQQGITRRNLLVGMESTGYYGNHLTTMLDKLSIRHISANPIHIKMAMGLVRGKSDKIDSHRIALHFYRSREELQINQPRRGPVEQLAILSTLRERMVRIEMKVKNPLLQAKGFLPAALQQTIKTLSENTRKAVDSDIKAIDNAIKKTWRSDPELKHLMKIVMSIPCIGEVTAVQIIVTTNEFKNICEAKKFACYAGVAPFPHQSGTALDHGTRTSKLSNPRMKTLISTCSALSTIHVPEIREYYLRKQAEGKHRMSVLNAISLQAHRKGVHLRQAGQALRKKLCPTDAYKSNCHQIIGWEKKSPETHSLARSAIAKGRHSISGPRMEMSPVLRLSLRYQRFNGRSDTRGTGPGR